MTVISHAHYDLLKRELLEVAGFKSISPADCKVISVLVTNKTRHCISETTLKRIYGFALSRFNPSCFTLDVLCRYCGHNSWKDFCALPIIDESSPAADDVDWKTLQKKAANVTNLTLQAIRNRSGIPYYYTIKRELVNAHLNEFIHSGYKGAILSAPAGYGKTMALSHWVEEKMELNAAGVRDDIVLFLNSNALINAQQSGSNLIEWVLALLGYKNSEQLIAQINKKQTGSNKFYLVIDSFDEHMFASDQFQVIVNYFRGLFTLYKKYNWLKIILALRSSTWISYRDELEADDNTWFTGFHSGNNQYNNIPLFSHKELSQLSLKINPLLQGTMAAETAEKLSHPLFFQYFYKYHRGSFSISSLDHVCIYQLSSSFILNKVYLGKNATEKVFIIKELVELMDLENERYTVEKSEVAGLLKQYNQAYQELLGIGFLTELNRNNGHHGAHACISFNNNFLEYSIAKAFLAKSDNQFNSRLTGLINETLSKSLYKLPVLKWCLVIAIKTGQQNSLDQLTNINLNANEKADLIMFIGDLLEKQCSSMKDNEQLLLYFKQAFSEKMFEFFFGLELINPNYKKTLATLLKFDLTVNQKILIQSALGIIAVIQLDLKELKTRLDELRKFEQQDMDTFVINPMNCLDILYAFFHENTIPNYTFSELDQLLFPDTLQAEQLKPWPGNDMLYILGAYTLLIKGDNYKVISYVNTIKNVYKTAEIEGATTQFAFFINLLTAEAWYGIGETDMALNIYGPISNTFGENGEQLSPIIKARFYSLKIKLLMNTPREDQIVNELKCINAIAEDSGNKILKMNVLMMLLKQGGVLNQYPYFKQQAVHDLTMIINRSGLNRSRFTVPVMVG